MKVKSHTGCLLNEHADKQAELGRMAEGPEICLAPKVRVLLAAYTTGKQSLQRKVANHFSEIVLPIGSLLEKVAAFDTILAVIKCSTHFFTGLLHHKERPSDTGCGLDPSDTGCDPSDTGVCQHQWQTHARPMIARSETSINVLRRCRPLKTFVHNVTRVLGGRLLTDTWQHDQLVLHCSKPD